MRHFYLDSTLSKLLVSITSTVGQLAWVGIGKGLIQRIGKLKNKERGGEFPTPIGCLRASLMIDETEDFNLTNHALKHILHERCSVHRMFLCF